jgi:hypothetical protein
MRAAAPSWELRRVPTQPALDALYKSRRPTLPPEACTHPFQASLRETSATT